LWRVVDLRLERHFESALETALTDVVHGANVRHESDLVVVVDVVIVIVIFVVGISC